MEKNDVEIECSLKWNSSIRGCVPLQIICIKKMEVHIYWL